VEAKPHKLEPLPFNKGHLLLLKGWDLNLRLPLVLLQPEILLEDRTEEGQKQPFR
jgi:hypothetical protein